MATDAAAADRVETFLDAIERGNPAIRSMITVMAAEARATAAAPLKQGALSGRIVSVKDNIDTAGVRTTRGSAWFADRVPNEDANVVARLRRAGAIIIGKDNMHEFAFGATSQNPHHGACRNPWNTDAVPGGSSGGSGASVAAGFSEIGIGSDTGGSVRIPAALNGVSGLRPSIGRISATGTFPIGVAYDTIGPLARRVVDVARAYEVLAGYDPADPFSADHPVESFAAVQAAGMRGLRVGLPSRLMGEEATPAVVALVKAAADALRDLGAVVVDLDIPGFIDAQRAFMLCAQVDAATLHRDRMAEDPSRFGADVERRLRLGASQSALDYSQAKNSAPAWRRQIELLFAGIDCVVMPTIGFTAPLAAETPDMIAATHKLTRLCSAWSFAEVPALSVPCGFVDGMPVGLQIIGPKWSEARVLAVGAAYQEVTDFHLQVPPKFKSQ